jgi:hypothetical protein
MIHVILGPTSRIELMRTLRGRKKLQRTWSHSDHVTPSPVHPPFPHEAPGAQLVQWWCPCLPTAISACTGSEATWIAAPSCASGSLLSRLHPSTPHRDSIPSPAMAEGVWTTNGRRTTARSCSTELKVKLWHSNAMMLLHWLVMRCVF